MALCGSVPARRGPGEPGGEGQSGLARAGLRGGALGLGICLGLGAASRLTYHEAFVAQGAREIVASGCWWHPAVGGLPWLEKPPLPFWAVAALGWCAGDVTPTVARLPSAAAALGLALGVGLLAARRYGSAIGILAAAVQITTAWTILRGRLAEAGYPAVLPDHVDDAGVSIGSAPRPSGTARAGSPHGGTTAGGPGPGPSWPAGPHVPGEGTGFGAAPVLSVVAVVLR